MLDEDQLTLIYQPEFGFSIRGIAQDSSGKFWVAGYKKLIKWDAANSTIEDRSSELESVEFITGLAIAPDDTIWISSSSHGIVAMREVDDRAFSRKTQWLRLPSKDRNIWGIYSNENAIWLGGFDVFYRHDKRTGFMLQLSMEGIDQPGFMYTPYPLGDNRLLAGTYSGAYVLDLPPDEELAKLNSFIAPAQKILSLKILEVYPDPMDHDAIWLGTPRGLYRLSRESMVVQPIPPNGAGQGDPGRISGIKRGHDGKLWVLGENSFGYLSDQGLVSLIDHIEVDNKKPRLSQILSIDSDLLWLGTYDMGLLEYKISSGKVRRINEELGLKCVSVVLTASTRNYDVVGCLFKLLRRNKITGDIDIFTGRDNLFGHELNESAVFFDRNDGLYLGTPEGLALINLDDLAIHRQPIPVGLESVSIYYDDREQDLLYPTGDRQAVSQDRAFPFEPVTNNDSKHGPISQYSQRYQSFAPGVRTLIFQLTPMDIISPTDQNYNYRFSVNGEPMSRKLIDLGQQNQIWLTSPPVGELTLEVQIGEDTGSYGPIQTYRFFIAPQWWQTLWFRFAVIASLAGLVIGLFIWRQRKLVRERLANQALRQNEQRFEIALNASRSRIWDFEPDNQTASMESSNENFSSTSLRLPPLEGMEVAVDDRTRLQRDWQKLISFHSDSIDGEYRIIDQYGQTSWHRLTGRPIEIDRASGKVSRVAGIISNVSEQHEIKARLDRFVRAIEASSAGTIVLDEAQRVVDSNPAAQLLLGYAVNDLKGIPFANLVDWKRPQQDLNQQLLGESDWSGEINLKKSNGDLCPVWLTMSRTLDSLHGMDLYVILFSDFSERRAFHEKLLALSNFESVTGLPNRGHFTEILESAVHRANTRQRNLAIVYLAIENLYAINEVYGFSTGDQILALLATRLHFFADSIGRVGQFSNNEFTILISDQTAFNKIEEFCQTLIETISRPFNILGKKHLLVANIGLSVFPDDSHHSEELIRNAHIAMINASQSAGTSYAYFNAASATEAAYRLTVEDDLAEALRQGELEIYFQPLIETGSRNQLFGVEALLRWNHPQLGWIRPDLILAAAESHGIVYELDRWILHEACSKAVRISEKFSTQFRLSVNFWPSTFLQEDVVDIVKATLSSTRLAPELLEIEVTEGVLVDNYSIARTHLERLRKIGVSLAIDDFGTGYSSLAYLRHLQVDAIKIDKCFVDELANNTSDQAIVDSLFTLGNALGIKVIVEGVELQDQLDYLTTQYGQGLVIQGYLFSKPLSENALERYLGELDDLAGPP